MSEETDLETRLKQAVRPALVGESVNHQEIATTIRNIADQVEQLEEVGL